MSTQPAAHGMALKVPLGVWQKTLGQRQQSRGTDGQDGWSQPKDLVMPALGRMPPHEAALPSPEVAASPLAVLVLGPAGPGTAHRGDSGGTESDADEAALLEEGRVVVGARPLGWWRGQAREPALGKPPTLASRGPYPDSSAQRAPHRPRRRPGLLGRCLPAQTGWCPGSPGVCVQDTEEQQYHQALRVSEDQRGDSEGHERSEQGCEGVS